MLEEGTWKEGKINEEDGDFLIRLVGPVMWPISGVMLFLPILLSIKETGAAKVNNRINLVGE